LIYEITHVTAYSYESPVASGYSRLRVTPRQGPGQQVLSSTLDIKPTPAEIIERVDFFGNRVHVVRIEVPHSELDIEARSRIIVERSQAPAGALTRPWEEIARDVLNAPSLDATSPVHFVYSSRYVPAYEPATRYARDSFAPGRPVLEAAIELMTRIRNDFRYDPGSTDISTPLAKAFEERGGVCQDFAHIMLSGLRGLGLSAAYVSGYIRTIPPRGKPRLVGADASHAWVSVWCGSEFGWIGLDPTNALIVVDDHIEVAIGRDYSDVSPVGGVFVGSGKNSLTVSVDVLPVGP
jgi:transglutaminase-like putative cysteine protease